MKVAEVRSKQRQRLSINAWDAVVFFIPTLKFIRLPFGGQLMGPEILLLLLAPLLVLTSGRRLLRPLPTTVFVLAVIWLGAQVISDFLNQTPVGDLVRGWAKIAFITIDFAVLYLLLNGRPKRLAIFAAGLAVGAVLEFLLNPTELASAYPWKFALSMPSSLTALILCVWLNTSATGRFLGIGLLMLMSAVNFYLDFRSMAGLLVLVAAMQLVPVARKRLSPMTWRDELKRASIVGLLLGAASAGILGAYSVSVESGLLGETAAYRYERQASGAYGLLLGGRSEILASSRAILDAPVWGHGSWAKDCRYTDLLYLLKTDLGYEAAPDDEDCRIPSHSHILGAWVEAGILGAVFWLVLMLLPVRGLIVLSLHRPRIAPLGAFFALLLVWDLMFSPYGGELRYRTLYEMVFMMTVLGLQDSARASVKAPRRLGSALAAT